ncbi:MAG: flagellar basal body P-ring formation chaperone FlgA [Polaromonas sp.]|nr:flagellar basal body P-ring formation chaperone FlgA [Polaromonas sp.]
MLCLLFPSPRWRALMALLFFAASALPSAALAQSAQENLLKQVRQWVAKTQSTTPNQVDLAPLDARVQVQPCGQALQMDLPFASRETVRVRCTQPPWQLYMRLQTPTTMNAGQVEVNATGSRESVNRKTVVTRHLIQRGTLLDASLLQEVTLPAQGVDPQAVASIQDLLYGELVRDVPAGQVLRSSDIRRAVLVKQGQSALMSVGQNDGFRITVRVEALQDGRMGEQIRLKNPDSGRLITGTVTGPNTVRGL